MMTNDTEQTFPMSCVSFRAANTAIVINVDVQLAFISFSVFLFLFFLLFTLLELFSLEVLTCSSNMNLF